MKKNILKKFAIAIASTSLALTAPVTMPDAFNTVQTVEAATVKTPSTVKLNKISSPAYNKIKISWKKASNATKYYVYYRKSGTKKWKKIASVKSSATSYTHTASYKYPLTVGQKYNYTVKAYNSKSKKSGKYNTKGLTTKTVPNAVTNFTALELSNNTVQLTWTRSMGADKYVVYRKASDTAKWQKLATINSTYYVDKAPVVNQNSYYMVKPYVSKYKVLQLLLQSQQLNRNSQVLHRSLLRHLLLRVQSRLKNRSRQKLQNRLHRLRNQQRSQNQRLLQIRNLRRYQSQLRLRNRLRSHSRLRLQLQLQQLSRNLTQMQWHRKSSDL